MQCKWCKKETDNGASLCCAECAFRMKNLLETRIERLRKTNLPADRSTIKDYTREIEEINKQYEGVITPCLD